MPEDDNGNNNNGIYGGFPDEEVVEGVFMPMNASDGPHFGEDFLRGAARGYADSCGQSLLSEQRDLERQGIRYHLPRADAKIARIKRGRQRVRQLRVLAAAAAACLALVFVLPQLISTPAAEQLSPSQEDSVAELSPGPQDAAAGELSPDPEDAAAGGLSPDPEGSAAVTAEPLRFDLPSRFAVSGTDVDNGKNIYFLTDTAGEDPVVLTAEDPAAEPYDPENMDTVYIDGTPVAAEVTQDYNLLMFESDGRLYTLVCKYDMGALAQLYRSIVYTD